MIQIQYLVGHWKWNGQLSNGTCINLKKQISHDVKTKFYNHEYFWPGFEEPSPPRGSVSSAAVISHWFDHICIGKCAFSDVLLQVQQFRTGSEFASVSNSWDSAYTWRISVWVIKQQRQHQHTCVNLEFFSSCSASDLAWLLLQANTASLISTEGTLRRPMTYDDHLIQSQFHPIQTMYR